MTTAAAITSTPGKMDYIATTDWRLCVTFDYADATWSVTERRESENMTSSYEHFGNVQSFTLPANTDASMFKGWVAEIVQPLLERIKAGYSTEWTRGNRWIAVYSADAISAKKHIDYLIARDNGGMALSWCLMPLRATAV